MPAVSPATATRTRRPPVVLLACLVATGAIAPGLGGLRHPFLHDDRWAVVDNPVVRDGVDPVRILSTSAWGDAPDHRHIPNYRPLSVLSLAVTHAAAGLEPLPYRVTNLALHAAVSVLLLLACLALGLGALPATAGALWFATHPVHAEAIFFVVNREELLCAAFVLAALSLALRRSSLVPVAPPAPAPGRDALIAGLLAAAALLSKEGAVALPVLLGTVALAWPAAPGSRRNAAAIVAASLLALAAYLALRLAAMGRLMAGHVPWQDNPLVQADLPARLSSALALVWHALGLLFAPVRFTVDYGFDTLGLPGPGPTAATWLGLATLAAVVAGFVALRRRAPVVALGLALLAIAYALPSNLLFPNSILFAERLLYLPSAGAALALAGAADIASRRLRRAKVAARLPAIAVLAWAVAFAGMLHDRNRDFADGRTLFETSLAAWPRSTRLWNNLAIEYQNAGDWEASEVALGRSLAIDPTNAEARNNLGLALGRRGDLRGAAREFGTALDLRPGMPSALGNLCLLLETQPDPTRAVLVCEMAVRRGAPVSEALERVRARAASVSP